MKSFALSLSALLLAVTLAGCSESPSSSQTEDKGAVEAVEVSLKVCPMCQMDVNKEVATTSFDGKTIGYCNEHCKETFENMSAEEKNKLLAKLEKGEKEHDHEHEEGHDHDKKEENKES